MKSAGWIRTRRPKDHADQGRRLECLLLGLGLQRPQAAKMLHVTERTLHNWITGRHAVPYSAFKLVRVMCRMDIPFPGWEGWTFCAGHLYSPEGHRFSGKDSSWWSLLVRQARMFSPLCQENAQLRQRIRILETAGNPVSLVPGFSAPAEVTNAVTRHFSPTSETNTPRTAPTQPSKLGGTRLRGGPASRRKRAPLAPKSGAVQLSGHAAADTNPTARDRLARFLPRGAR